MPCCPLFHYRIWQLHGIAMLRAPINISKTNRRLPRISFRLFVRLTLNYIFIKWTLVRKKLLPDAEFGEDVVEDVVGGDLAGNLAQMVQDPAQILA